MRMVCEPRNTNTSNNGHRITRYRVFINWTVTDWAAVRFSKSANLRLIREIQCIHHEIAALSSFCIRTVSIWLSVFSSNSLCFNLDLHRHILYCGTGANAMHKTLRYSYGDSVHGLFICAFAQIVCAPINVVNLRAEQFHCRVLLL